MLARTAFNKLPDSNTTILPDSMSVVMTENGIFKSSKSLSPNKL